MHLPPPSDLCINGFSIRATVFFEKRTQIQKKKKKYNKKTKEQKKSNNGIFFINQRRDLGSYCGGMTEQDYIWQDRELRFDSPEAHLKPRPGEKVIDSINSVEDTKGWRPGIHCDKRLSIKAN